MTVAEWHDTHRNRKNLVVQIGAMSQEEHCEIYKILCSEDIHTTRNANGAFVNFSSLSSDVVERIAKFVIFSMANKADLDEYDRRISACKMYNECRGVLLDDNTDDGDANDGPMEDWNAVIRNIVKTPKQSESLGRSVEVLNRAQALESRLQRKMATNNKFAATKKKYAKRSMAGASGRGDTCDLPDVLEPDDVIAAP